MIRLTLLTIISFFAFLAGCAKQASEYQNLSEKPPISVIPYRNTMSESVIQTRLSIPLSNLQERLEDDIPKSLYNDSGKIRQKCIRIFGKKLCESYQVGGWAQRTGPIQLIPLNNGYLRIAIPLQYKLDVKGRGKVVKELLRNIKFRTAAFTAIADLKLSVSSQWQLQLAAHSSIQWQKSPKVKVLGVELNIKQKVEKPILKALDKALKKQQIKMAADERLRKRVEHFWTTLHQPRKLQGNFPLWLNASPAALDLSAIRIDDEAIRVDLALRTLLSTSANGQGINNEPSPLPLLTNRSVQPSLIRISLPLALSYDALASSFKQRLKNKPIEYKQGDISISVKAIEIYPNNDRLVLAAKVKLNGLLGLLSSDGEVYISGKPVIDNESKTLKLSNVEFSRKLDSQFWNATTQLLHKQLLTGLQDALVYDFSNNYSEVYRSINQQLNSKPAKNVKLNGQLETLRMLNIQPDLDELRVTLEAEGIVNLELTNL